MKAPAPVQSPAPALPPTPAPVPAHVPVSAPVSAPAPPPATATAPAHSPSFSSSGFTAVNTRHSLSSNEYPAYHASREPPRESRESQSDVPRDLPRDTTQGSPVNGSLASPIQHIAEQKPAGQAEDWMNKFLTPGERAAGMTADTIRRETLAASQRSNSRGETMPAVDDSMRMASITARRQDSRRQSEGALPDRNQSVQQPDVQGPSVPIPSTPASLMPQQKPHTWNRDDGGPYKAEMISRMETMKRGERVIPPCDRCRRLHMDCIKNLTACLGCTKKHAKCSWKDVSLEELESTAPAARERAEKEAESAAPSSSDWDNILKQTKSDISDPTRATPSSNSPTTNDRMEISSNKASTPHMPSPTRNGSNHERPPSHPQESNHPQESPRLNVRPPPLDQQLRDAAEDKPAHHTPFARFSPFQRPTSAHQTTSSAQPKEEAAADEGDRLAAVAAQVYRSASQNAARSTESRAPETL